MKISAKNAALLAGPLVYFIVILLPQNLFPGPEAQKLLAAAAWMLTWWISEAIYLGVTALLPLVLFPLNGLGTVAEAAAPFSNPMIFLFLGGFMLALGLERHKLHLRIALNIIRLTGTKANGIIAGFMLATALLSMWISNTATTVMMLPIAASVIQLLGLEDRETSRGEKRFALGLMLGIAYGANIGGMATLIGTPPNVVLAGTIKSLYGYQIMFGDWLMIGLPVSVLMWFAAYFLIVKLIYPNRLGNFEAGRELIRSRLAELGPMRTDEKRMVAVFAGTAMLWVFGSYITTLFPAAGLSDTVTAVLATLLLFTVPSAGKPGTALLEWEDTKRLPWGILLLFGGGMSLAEGFSTHGLIDLIGKTVSEAALTEVWVLLLILITLMLFLTELASNVALTMVFVPLVAAIAVGFGINPLIAAVPVTLAASCAFMLPMATPPNAIVFAGGHIKISEMMRIGLWLNVVGVIILLAASRTLVPLIFGGTDAVFLP